MKQSKEISEVKRLRFNLHKAIEEKLLNHITEYLISNRIDYCIVVENEIAYMKVRFYRDSLINTEILMEHLSKEMNYLKDFYSELYQVEDY